MNEFIFLLVVSLRFFIPLLILRYPLPALMTAMMLDAVDQTVFQTFTTLPLDGYQGYDKALDIYYLTIAYVSTFRNWESYDAFKVSRFLYYYRMVGVGLFEATQWRTILLIFPNTFEYFFVYVEVLRTRWNISRLPLKRFVAAAAFIWIFIKLPQEYWIHVAQRDVTDTIKYNILGAPVGASWAEAVQGHALGIIGVAVIFACLVAIAVRSWQRASEDWPMRFTQISTDDLMQKIPAIGAKAFGPAFKEKVAMLTLICFVFAHILPGIEAHLWQIILGVVLIVAANALLSIKFGDTLMSWQMSAKEFFILAVLNSTLITLYGFIMAGRGQVDFGISLFFALLLTLLITLYDRYRAVYETRFLGA